MGAWCYSCSAGRSNHAYKPYGWGSSYSKTRRRYMRSHNCRFRDSTHQYGRKRRRSLSR